MEEFVLAYDRYKQLAEKQRLTAAEKAEIEERAKELGIPMNKKCSSCYRDAAVQIALAYKPMEEQQEGEYELYDDIDITIHSFRFGELHVCPKNCTTVMARKWREAGLPLRFFKKYPHEGNEQD